MRGRTMYVVPFSMGPLGSPISYIGVQLTDSPYVAVSMRIMTRMGQPALDVLGEDGDFVPCLHSVGMPLVDGAQDVPWPCNADNKYIVHFPETREIWSFGSGYGGNALLGKKCFALRIASVMARDEGWLAEHMLILKLTSPEGEVKYIAGAFPSACGKTNLSMMIPTLPGWKVETIGDDIAWMKFGDDGQLYAVNPECGLLRRGARHRSADQPQRDRHDGPRHHLHQLRQDRRRRRLVGGADRRAAGARDRLAGQRVDARLRHAGGPSERPLHRARGPVPVDRRRSGRTRRACRSRRSCSAAAARRSCRWCSRPATGSTACSWARSCPRRRPPPQAGQVGKLRFDPMAMLPFCGYHMGDYFGHWLRIGEREGAKLPRIFYVNWFRKDDDGQVPVARLRRELARPGLDLRARGRERRGGRDARSGCCRRSARAGSTPPISTSARRRWPSCSRSTPRAGTAQLPQIREHFAEFGDRLPAELRDQLEPRAAPAPEPSAPVAPAPDKRFQLHKLRG